MQSDDLVYVGHMLDKALHALRLVHDKTKTDYDKDEVLRLALVHLLQTIGEAARKISIEYCTAHPDIAWRAIRGMRHRIVHDYMDVDEDVVWDTVRKELEPLTLQLRALLPDSD